MQPTYGIRQLANWTLDFAEKRGVKITNMALNKLLYFAYEHFLVEHQRRLTGAKIEAWEHGPVFREVYRSFSDCGNKPIGKRANRFDPKTGCVEVAPPTLTDEDERIMEDALDALVGLPAFILREISHAPNGSWAAVWHHDGSANPGMQITDDVIRNCRVNRILS